VASVDPSNQQPGSRKQRRAWLWAAFAAALVVVVLFSRSGHRFRPHAVSGPADRSAVVVGGTGALGRNTCPTSQPVKGNITERGDRIYHVAGGTFYPQTNPEACFATPQEAQAAGFRASSR
jgi:hypothetical protein